MFLVLAAGCSTPAVPEPSDAAPDAPPSADSFAPDAVAADAPPPPSACAGTGTAMIRVSLDVQAAVDLGDARVAIAAMCLDHGVERPIRLAWADRTARTTTLAALPAGTYVVRANALLVPGTRSPELVLSDGAMTVTQLTLSQPERPMVLRTLSLAPVADAGVPDAGLPDVALPDAAAPDAPGLPDGAHPGLDAGLALDAGLVPATRSEEIPILRSATSTERVGTVRLRLTPRGDGASDLAVDVRNECPTRCGLMPRGLEFRVERAGLPTWVGAMAFDGTVIDSGGTRAALPASVVVPTSLNDPTSELSVAFFGSLQTGP